MLRALALTLALVPSPQQNTDALNNGAAEYLSPLEEVITELTEVLETADKHPGTREKVQLKYKQVSFYKKRLQFRICH